MQDLVNSVTFSPFDPSNAVIPATSPARATQSLLDNRICQVTGALQQADRDTIRARAEAKMAGVVGGTLPMILGERREGPDEIFDVDVSLFLAVLRSPVWPIVRAYFKARVGVEDAIMIPMNTLVRRFVPNEDRNEDIRIPFHQDAFGFPDTFMAVNCWVLMSPDECGMTAPGLEFIPDRLDHMIPLEKNPATKHYGFLETSHEVIERMLGHYRTWSPSIQLGDVTIFDGFALHRTYLHPKQTRPRYSAEVRFIAKTPDVEDHMNQHRQDVFTIRKNAMHGPSALQQVGGKVVALSWGRWTY
jgi:hypothetical protein